MAGEIRKIVRYLEDLRHEGGRPVERPVTLFAAAAVIRNPWAGRGYVADLKPEIDAVAPGLGALLTAEMLALGGGGAAIEAYGKAAVVGTDGELEHASALIHTLRFGNHYRTAVEAQSYLAFSNTRGGANAPVVIPMMDKHDVGRRSHYLTLQFAIADAPAADEIVVALGGATGGRPHHRIGDRYQDLKDLGHDLDKPAGG